MSNPLPDFTILRPATIDAAITGLADHPEARLCAGGSDLIVNMRHGLVETDTLIDLTGIDALQGIDAGPHGARIGAGVRLCDLLDNAEISQAWPAIHQAAAAIAGPTHREVATVGGNLCLDTRCLYYNQSHWWRKSNDFCLKYRGDICHVAPKGNRCRAAFCGDLAPALMVCGAEVELAGPTGTRRLPLAEFYREDGADPLTLQPGEILIAVQLPPAPPASAYAKVRVRGAIDFPLAGVAVAMRRTGDARHFTLAFTGTNSSPVMVEMPGTLGPDDDPDTYFTALEKLAQKTVSPQRTTTVQPHYRRLAVSALARRLAAGMAA